jgi:anthranilate phosphoribosyltransferase
MEAMHLIKYHSNLNIPLSFGEAYELGLYAIKGCAGDKDAQGESFAVLSALHNRATYAWRRNGTSYHLGHALPLNAAEQIAGICAAIFEKDIAESESGFLHPKVPYVMDNCGMGGDIVTTANVSTLASFIAAAAGIPMCKHGSPSNSDTGKCGSSNFIDALGINTRANRADVEKCVEEERFGYTEALDTRYKHIHLQTHKFIKLPHMNDIIGVITNPLDPRLMTRRVVGLNHLIAPMIAAEAYQILNLRGTTDLRHGLFVQGMIDSEHKDGMDEVSICEGGTNVAELKNGNIREYRLHASDFGINPVSPASISPPGGMKKSDFSLGILRGEITGAPLQMVLANAALLFFLAERSNDLKECYAMAEAVHHEGGAYKKMLAVRERLPK